MLWMVFGGHEGVEFGQFSLTKPCQCSDFHYSDFHYTLN